MTAMLCVNEKRRYARVPASLPGRLFSGDAPPQECQIVNLSCAGVAIRCEDAPRSGMLYIEHLGRVAVIGRRRENGVSGFEFDCSERKRWEIGLAIAQYVTSGVTQLTRQRRRERLAVSGICITRSNGESAICDAVDISSCGVSLRTGLRPPVGERIDVQGAQGRVVRHHADGIAVELVQNGPSAVVRFPKGLDTQQDEPPDEAG
jgi:hypothetical protein